MPPCGPLHPDLHHECRKKRLMKLMHYGLSLAAFLLAAPEAGATTVTFNTDSAKAVIAALTDPRLTIDQAGSVARLSGNRGVTRELKSFGIPASDEIFAKALYAAAHGEHVTDAVQKSYDLEAVKEHLAEISDLVTIIERDPERFQGAIQKRIAQFTSTGANIRLQGYVVAAGDGGGYTFGSTDFFLNTARVRDLVLAEAVANHEMYHAVQGAFASARAMPAGLPGGSACAATQKLFDNLYEEGTAAYVEDVALVDRSTSEAGLRKQTDLKDGIKHVTWSSSLLEMSIDALTAPDPTPYQQVYAVGFYGHGVLYNIAYVMAEAIVADRGASGLIALLTKPSYEFVLSYILLPNYGKDATHPELGRNTVAMARKLATACK